MAQEFAIMSQKPYTPPIYVATTYCAVLDVLLLTIGKADKEKRGKEERERNMVWHNIL